MANETPRNYTSSDAYMVETSRTLHALLTVDLAEFTAFDADFTPGYLTNWLAAIDAAGDVVRDAQVQDVIEAETAEVTAKMTECRKKYNEVKYFAGKAFPTNKPVRDEFGTEDYKKARNSQAKLIELMGILHKAAEKYKVQLIAQQYTQPKIDAILTLRNELQAENTGQNAAIKGRPVLSNERVNTLNAAYEFTAQVCEAAQLVYDENPVKQDQYVFNSRGSSETILGTQQGTVGASLKVNLGVPPAGTTKVRMTNLAGGPLEYGFSADGLNFNGNTVTLGAPGQATQLVTDFLTTGTTFVVFNQNGSDQGEYKVDFIE